MSAATKRKPSPHHSDKPEQKIDSDPQKSPAEPLQGQNDNGQSSEEGSGSLPRRRYGSVSSALRTRMPQPTRPPIEIDIDIEQPPTD